MGDPQARTALDEVKLGLAATADAIVPWFFKNMHEYYFRTHSHEELVRHLQAIISGQVTTQNQTLLLRSPCGTRITYITPGASPRNLVTALKHLEPEAIQTTRLYTSFDRALSLITFHLTDQEQASPSSREFRQVVDRLTSEEIISREESDSFSRFLSCTSADYVEKFEPGRAARHFRLVQTLTGEDVLVSLEEQVYPREDRITVAMRNPPATGILVETAKVLNRFDIPARRAYADVFDLKDGNTAAIITLYAEGNDQRILRDSALWRSMEQDLQLLKWYAPDRLERFADEHGWSLGDVSLLQATCLFAHQVLLRSDPYAYTHDRIRNTMLSHPDMAEKLLGFFRARFSPDTEHREQTCAELLHDLETAIQGFSSTLTRNIFQAVLDFYLHTLRTNRYLPGRFGLAFRLDPAVFEFLSDGPEPPFGVFFFHGARHIGFHVRYRDMARGGLRLVQTRSMEHYKMESNRVFDEVTALAKAQQIKNKDIPEGGAKAILLLRPDGEVDLSVKSLVNSLLDVIVSSRDSAVLEGVVDYLDRHEIIYLGPDEHIKTGHVQWIVEQARRRGYTWPAALMSSKPGAGISHKTYGVTSLGVVVFLEEILRLMGIDPGTQPFTVKITGGPAGDVAGNVLKIMIRKFGPRVRVLAMSDGHGAACDPKGLDHGELLRLVGLSASIDAFDPARLSGEGAFVITADTLENKLTRDELHNAVKADIFLPCGGRPDTINAANWDRFLDHNGLPTAGAIVEGANLFLSDEARLKLQQENVLIVHGSSANKCGVIASSYEVLAGLILSDEEFLAIKETYVAQVLELLEKRARDEARLLLHEFKLSGGRHPLTQVTLDLSAEINTLGDKIAEALSQGVEDLTANEHLCRTLLEYCPPVLAEKYRERVVHDLPARYRFALLGAHLSSYIVYTEGTGWLRQLLQVRDVFRVIQTYLEQGSAVSELLQTLSSLEDAPGLEISRIVSTTGRKYLTTHSLGLE